MRLQSSKPIIEASRKRGGGVSAAFLFKATCALVVFIYSLALTPYAVEGDQLHYIKIYKEMSILSFSESYSYYQLNLDSKEVVHFFVSWVASHIGLSKDLFISLSNALLAYLMAALFIQLNLSKVIAFVIIASSFYLNVLYFSAERLKFGFIFFIASFLYVERPRVFYTLLCFSILSHAQMLISYLSVGFSMFMAECERVLLKGRLSKVLLIFMVLAVFLGFIIGPHIVHKFLAYQTEIKLYDVTKILIIMLLTLYYASNKKQAFFVFFPLVIAVMLVGSDRVFMLGYFVFLYYAAKVNRGYNFGVVVTTAYFSLKSIDYLYNLIVFGNGFYRGGM